MCNNATFICKSGIPSVSLGKRMFGTFAFYKLIPFFLLFIFLSCMLP